jgi:tryptophan halogenase
VGHDYWHQFGEVGFDIDAKPFYQHWLKYRLNGGKDNFTDFSPAIAMANSDKFYIQPAGEQPSVLSSSSYAYHIDAGLLAECLPQHGTKIGVEHVKGTIDEVNLHDNGRIKHLLLKDGRKIEGDLFVDCSGQKGLLIEGALGIDYLDWNELLPVDRAVAIQTVHEGPVHPYTESVAHECGWMWRIPLQHRVGNGYVYCSRYCTDEQAKELLLKNVKGEPLTEPRLLKFRTGKRDKFWHKNCVSIGLSSGFIEPLESTGIHLSMRSALNLLQMIPNMNFDQATINEYNRLMDIEYDCIRDFIVLHFSASNRIDSEFWKDWQNRSIPDSLINKLALFKSQGRLMRNDMDLFSSASWYAVLEGMKVRPGDYDRTIDSSDELVVRNILSKAISALDSTVEKLPSHKEYIEKVCR